MFLEEEVLTPNYLTAKSCPFLGYSGNYYNKYYVKLVGRKLPIRIIAGIIDFSMSF